MKIWIDAQLPPTLANWLTDNFNLEAVALRDIQLRDAQDTEIFESAQAEKAVIMTKDSDFIDLVCRLGAPPQIFGVYTFQVSSFQTIFSLVNCPFTKKHSHLH
jgi:predicted nuclease of predicted toxin-antitoxin system